MNNVHIQRPKDSFLYSGLIDFVNDLDKKYNMRNKTMIEIGSFQGESTEVFASVFDKIYAIDPWENGYDQYDISSYATEMSLVEKSFDTRMSFYNGLIKVKSKSSDFFKNFDQVVDFIYIDGNHQYEYILQDLKYASKFSRYIGGHDWKMFAVDEALKTFYKTEDLSILNISIYNDSSWIFKNNLI